MSLIEDLCKKISAGKFEFSKHAVDQSIIRKISVQEIREVFIRESELIEDYPDDKYGSSCLILGFTKANRPLHVQCSYPTRPIIKIITLYEPSSTHWIKLRKRKKK